MTKVLLLLEVEHVMPVTCRHLMSAILLLPVDFKPLLRCATGRDRHLLILLIFGMSNYQLLIKKFRFLKEKVEDYFQWTESSSFL